MARTDQTSDGDPADSSDKAIWEYCRGKDAEPDPAERFLDLAGFADARLDADERERVAALLAGEPEAQGDVVAAQALAAAVQAPAAEAVVARAVALIGEGAERRGQVIPFARFARPGPRIYRVASWVSLAASVAVASWLGFALGSDASLAFGQTAQSSEDGFLGDLIDPSSGVLHSINDGLDS